MIGVNQFEVLQNELSEILKPFKPVIEHIGSTSIPNLSAKPVVDVQVGVVSTVLFDAIVEKMELAEDYIYYQVFNQFLPQRRLFVKIKSSSNPTNFPKIFTDLETIPHEAINKVRMAHVHVWEFNSPDWIRHIAFRDYLSAHPQVCKQYEDLKLQLSQQDWKHGMAYNEGKEQFIKEVEQKAINWFQKN